jgi:hypothetical protein
MVVHHEHLGKSVALPAGQRLTYANALDQRKEVGYVITTRTRSRLAMRTPRF